MLTILGLTRNKTKWSSNGWCEHRLRKPTVPVETHHPQTQADNFPTLYNPDHTNMQLSVCVTALQRVYCLIPTWAKHRRQQNKGVSQLPWDQPGPYIKGVHHKQACCCVSVNHMSPLWQPSLPSWLLVINSELNNAYWADIWRTAKGVTFGATFHVIASERHQRRRPFFPCCGIVLSLPQICTQHSSVMSLLLATG